MAELWKPPRTDESSGSSPRGMDRLELRATLADLARAAERETQPPGVEPAPGPAGHQALAALAATAAPVAEDSRSTATDPSPASEIAAPARPLPTPAILSGGVPHPAGGASSPPAGAALSDRPAPPRLRLGGNGSPGGLPRPASTPMPGAVRLPGQKPTPAVPAALDQPTIALRRRAVTNGPASVSAAPPDPSAEPAPAPAAAAAKPPVQVTAWTPSDDDILPRRPLRRGRSWRRR